ncbi:helix-turn-helix domain-containing protein [Croceivirga thetidis]|uniref:AraC family transcriptional regulator n=1 Tax=Croceivirga thetidis TaxID=2721623 RepID=A0ABX1GNW0_9FLAO|nr:helix-turn-helix domain-containing protein [Croceivirga thetidis]NKI31612.1 AraC family transcriptional regulator [Croceivirga thetidis]
METLEQLIEQIPIRHNFISTIMFMGVFLGFFLSMVIFIRAKKNSPVRLFGWALLVQSLVCLDTYCCYTGLIKNVLQLNDSTEPLVLLIPTTIYFFMYSLLERKPILFRTHWWHFILPIGYLISQIGYYLSPLSVKLNAYLGAYYQDLTFAQTPDDYNYGYHVIKDEFRWLILFNFLLYLYLSIRLVIKKSKASGKPTKFIRVDKYVFSRNTILVFIVFFVLLFFVYASYEDDGGDHFIVMGQCMVTLVTLFFILSESRFFENSWIAEKYETLTSGEIELDKIEQALLKDNYFLSSTLSLKSLAIELNIGPNTLSKTINSEFGMNFNDYINKKRIAEAKERLVSKEYDHLTIEAIGNSVGFNSKSAFYTAFKRHANTSPSAFVKEHVS